MKKTSQANTKARSSEMTQGQNCRETSRVLVTSVSRVRALTEVQQCNGSVNDNPSLAQGYSHLLCLFLCLGLQARIAAAIPHWNLTQSQKRQDIFITPSQWEMTQAFIYTRTGTFPLHDHCL